MSEALTAPDFSTIPVGPLALIALPGCEELAAKIDAYLKTWREIRESEHKTTIAFSGYQRDSYLIKAVFPRFGSGESKCHIQQSVRGYDIFIVCDMFNYGLTYKMYGKDNMMSPDDHYANLKRAISAIGGKARRITVIMPMLYEGRQHKRSSRESLDCAMALQELSTLGVDNLITFDAHDARVQNAIPNHGFENIQPAYQMIKALVKNEGKDVVIVDDMISSGESMIEVATKLKELKARRIFVCTCFGLFCNGLEAFDKAYESGLINKVFTTNLIYRTPELKQREWYVEVDLSKYISYVIDTLNHDTSVSKLLDPKDRINNLLVKKGFRTAEEVK